MDDAHPLTMFPKRPLIGEGDAAAKKRKHKTISMLEKVELLQKLESGTSVRSLCEVYGISSSTVYDLKKQKEQIFSYFADNVSQKSLEKRKSLRRGKSTELDTALLRWFKQRRVEGVCVTGEMLMEQAKVLHRELSLDHTCEYSQGWLHRFKGRYGISLLSAPGEGIVAETEAEALDDCARFEKAEKLSPEQICSTELSYHCIPRNNFVQDDEASIVGGKEEKDKTGLAARNVNGFSCWQNGFLFPVTVFSSQEADVFVVAVVIFLAAFFCITFGLRCMPSNL